MSKTIVDMYVIFYVMGAIGAIGILSKCVSKMTLKRLLKESSHMAKSNHKLMRLVRAKFEHACMVSDKVENIEVFVEKYLYEYRTLGMKLHTWKRLGKQMVWLGGIATCAGMGLSYLVYGVGNDLIAYGVVGGIMMAVLFLGYHSADEEYKLKVIKIYMVDYLENVCARRYMKAYAKEGQVQLQDIQIVPAEMNTDALKASEEQDSGEVIEREPAAAAVQPEPMKEPIPLVHPGEDIPQVPIGDPGQDIPSVPQEEPVIPLQAEEQNAPVEQMPRETLIREILEEFLA